MNNSSNGYKNIQTSKCKICKKDISVGSVGVKALRLHVDEVKHKQRMPKDDRSSIASCSKSNDDILNNNVEKLKQTTITTSTDKQIATNAEIMWVLEVVMCRYSFNSCANKNHLFCSMFPDSRIAKECPCGRTKCSYIVNYGIAPYFLELLTDELKEASNFVALFDESYNYVTKKSQVDVHIRFWDKTTNKVVTRYFTSKFLGKTSVKDLMDSFISCISGLDKSKLIEVSSDGPNVNLAFLKNLQELRAEEELPRLIDIGTCGLHVVHGSFQHLIGKLRN